MKQNCYYFSHILFMHVFLIFGCINAMQEGVKIKLLNISKQVAKVSLLEDYWKEGLNPGCEDTFELNKAALTIETTRGEYYILTSADQSMVHLWRPHGRWIGDNNQEVKNGRMVDFLLEEGKLLHATITDETVELDNK